MISNKCENKTYNTGLKKDGVVQNGLQASPQGPQRPSTSPQVPNYPSSGQYSNRPDGTSSQSIGFGRPSAFVGDIQNGFPSSTTPGRYQGFPKPTQGSQYLPPVQALNGMQPGTYSGPQNPTQSDVNQNRNSIGYSQNQQTNPSSNIPRGRNGGQLEPSQTYSGGQQTNAGYSNTPGAYPSNQLQQSELHTDGANSKSEQPHEGYPSAQRSDSLPSGGKPSGVYSGNQPLNGGYSSAQQSSSSSLSPTYPNEQQSNGRYSNTQTPSGYPTRGYLPPAGK